MAPELKPGDIVAFLGRGFESALINVCTYGIPFWGISHVGIIGEYKNELLLFESTTLCDIPCLIQGKPFKGTQACHLEDRLQSYGGKVWHYPLHRRLFDFEATRLNRFLFDHVGVPYDREGAMRAGGNLWNWFASFLYGEDLKLLFCSELCTAAYHTIGLIRTDNVSAWSPNRFVRYGRRERILMKPRRLK